MENTDITSSIEDVNSVTKHLKVSIPASIVTSKVSESVGNVMKNAKVKGFRPGKAPRQMVEKLYGDRVRMEVVNDLITSSLRDLVKKHDLAMIGTPEIDVKSIEAGKELEYTANISVFPQPTITGYDKFEVTVQNRSVSDEDVEKIVENALRSKSTLGAVSGRAIAETGDVAQLKLVVQEEGEDAGNAEPYSAKIGSTALPTQVSDALVGMKIGESKEVSFTADDNYPSPKLRGKNLKYTVELEGISVEKLPEADDIFAMTIDPEVKSMSELRTKIREHLTTQAETEGKNDAQAKILDQLCTTNQFDVPQIMVDEEIKSLLSRNGIVDPQKVDLRQLSVERFREHLGEVATKRVRTAVAVDRIGEAEKILATDEDFEKYLTDISASSGLGVEDVRNFFADEGRKENVLSEIVRDKVLELLMTRTKITYSDLSEEADAKTEAADDGKEKKSKGKKKKE